jgi:CO/xanthine dehydrogenase FAD-binding subunit
LKGGAGEWREKISVKWFDYAVPVSMAEALGLMAKNPGALLLAGGTDLLVQLRSGRKATGLVIDIKRIPELNEIRCDDSGLTLGAAVPCYRIYGDPAVARNFPALSELAGIIGGTLIQGRASLGGNLCNSAPSADSVALLIAMGAICHILGPSGRREVAVEDFCTGPGTNILRPGELLVSFFVPRAVPGSGACYLRFIPRNEMDIAVVGAGVSVTLEDGHIAAAKLALAAVAPVPLLVREASGKLAGLPVNETSITLASDLARAAARPITDMRGSAEYRRHLCAVMTRRAMQIAIQRAQGGR